MQSIYRLKQEWAHHTLEEALDRKLSEAVAMAARGERSLPYSRIPGLLIDCFEVVPTAAPKAPRSDT